MLIYFHTCIISCNTFLHCKPWPLCRCKNIYHLQTSHSLFEQRLKRRQHVRPKLVFSCNTLLCFYGNSCRQGIVFFNMVDFLHWSTKNKFGIRAKVFPKIRFEYGFVRIVNHIVLEQSHALQNKKGIVIKRFKIIEQSFVYLLFQLHAYTQTFLSPRLGIEPVVFQSTMRRFNQIRPNFASNSKLSLPLI